MSTVPRRRTVMAGLVMVVSVGVSLAVAPTQAVAHGQPAGWGVAAPVAGVNDPVAADGCPIEAPDGKSLFIASMRGPGGDNDIWVATRSSLGEDFGAPTMLPGTRQQRCAGLLPDPPAGRGSAVRLDQGRDRRVRHGGVRAR